jgi:hypothetical protein
MLLAHAMRHQLTGDSHRPRRIRVRGHHQWRQLFPHLAELGIEVAVQKDDKPDGLAEAMAALEKGLTEYFEREGIDID